jgi:hypothetical protein
LQKGESPAPTVAGAYEQIKNNLPVPAIRMKAPMVSGVAQPRSVRGLAGISNPARNSNRPKVFFECLDLIGRYDRADIAVRTDQRPICRVQGVCVAEMPLLIDEIAALSDNVNVQPRSRSHQLPSGFEANERPMRPLEQIEQADRVTVRFADRRIRRTATCVRIRSALWRFQSQ